MSNCKKCGGKVVEFVVETNDALLASILGDDSFEACEDCGWNPSSEEDEEE